MMFGSDRHLIGLPIPQPDESCLLDDQYNLVAVVKKALLPDFLEQQGLVAGGADIRYTNDSLSVYNYVYPQWVGHFLDNSQRVPLVLAPVKKMDPLAEWNPWGDHTLESLTAVLRHRLQYAISKYPYVSYSRSSVDEQFHGKKEFIIWCREELIKPLKNAEPIYGPGEAGTILRRSDAPPLSEYLESLPDHRWHDWAPLADYEHMTATDY